MRARPTPRDDDEIPDEIDLSNGVRGKHYEWAKRAKGRFVIVSDEEDRRRQARLSGATDAEDGQSDDENLHR